MNKGENSLMIFCEWIKSMLNIDKVLENTSIVHYVRKITPKHPSIKTKRYHIYGTNVKNSLIATKTVTYRVTEQEDLSCLTATRNQQENIKTIFESDFLTIGIENHEFGTI